MLVILKQEIVQFILFRHSRQLLKNMKKFHFTEMSNLEIDSEKVESPTPLPW